MQLGMIGLGRMGANMVRRLLRGGHQCVVYDVSPEPVKELAKEGAAGASSLDDLIDRAHFRRGKAAAWSVYGPNAARATGDYLFARAFSELSATGDAEAVDQRQFGDALAGRELAAIYPTCR